MLKKLIFKKTAKLCLTLFLIGVVGVVYGQSNQVISTINGLSPTALGDNFNKSEPNSSVTLDFSVKEGESWDEKDYSGNVVADCISGKVITGFEYTNITLQTFGVSRFSDVVFYVSSSDPRDNNGLKFKVAPRADLTGTSVFSSDGIIDISDSGNNDVVALTDQKFIIQLFEEIDDNPDALDAKFTSGTLKVWGVDLKPTNNCPFIEKAASQSSLSVIYAVVSEKSIAVGDLLTLQITIENSGPDEATDVVMENTFSNKLNLINFSCDDGTTITQSTELETIQLQNIAANSTLTCNIETEIIGFERINNSVLVTASNNSNITNNLATLVINGPVATVPINNKFALLLLLLIIMLVSRKAIKG